MSETILNRMSNLLARAKTLRSRKAKLDSQIEDEQSRPVPDPTKLRKLKSRKLALRDQIVKLEATSASLKPLAGHVAAQRGGLA